MDAAAIMAAANLGIRLATTAIDLYVRAAEAAQAGDMETASAQLAKARSHFSAARAAWDAAGTPTAT